MMDITGDYSRNPAYYFEVYILVTIIILIIIYGIISSIYYFIHFTDFKLNKVTFISNILLSSGLMAGFLCIFYFTYLKNIEKQVFINNITDIINTFIIGIPPNLKNYLLQLVQTDIVIIPDSSDNDVITNNSNIQKKAILIFGCLCITIIIGITVLLYLKGYSISKTISINLILLCSIILIEILFSTFFVANYITLDINNLIYVWLSIHQWADTALNSGSEIIWGKHKNLDLPPIGYYLYPFYDNE